MHLRGRVGVASGADSDVGKAIARALAAEGVSLMLIARPGHQVRALAEALEQEHGIRCFPASADVTDRGAVDRLVMHAEQHVGAIDVLVNTVPGRLTEALLPTMHQRGRGVIVDIGVPPDDPEPPPGLRRVALAADDASTVGRDVVAALQAD